MIRLISTLFRLAGHWLFRLADWLEGDEWTSHERYHALHSDKRLMERYGIVKTRRFKNAMVYLIQNQSGHKDKVTLIRSFNTCKRLYEVEYEGHLFYPIYDRQTHQIVTVLTEKQVHQMMPKDFKMRMGESLEEMMAWIGKMGIHSFVRFDPERPANHFTVMLGNQGRLDTEDPKGALRFLMKEREDERETVGYPALDNSLRCPRCNKPLRVVFQARVFFNNDASINIGGISELSPDKKLGYNCKECDRYYLVGLDPGRPGL